MANSTSIPVPCAECARQKELMEADGRYKVLSCGRRTPDQGICDLVFERVAQLLTLEKLDLAVPPANYDDLAKYAPHLEEGVERFGIDTPARIAAFLAQAAHESGDFMRVEENLNYSAAGLRKTWPARFVDDAFAQQYHRQPEKIANYVYAGRNGNGDTASGDGWRFRGRGLIQVTGRKNYTAYGQAIGDASVLANPALLTQPRHAALSACWFWRANQLNALADKGTELAFNDITQKINGGMHGKDDRLENWAQAKTALLA